MIHYLLSVAWKETAQLFSTESGEPKLCSLLSVCSHPVSSICSVNSTGFDLTAASQWYYLSQMASSHMYTHLDTHDKFTKSIHRRGELSQSAAFGKRQVSCSLRLTSCGPLVVSALQHAVCTLVWPDELQLRYYTVCHQNCRIRDL